MQVGRGSPKWGESQLSTFGQGVRGDDPQGPVLVGLGRGAELGTVRH